MPDQSWWDPATDGIPLTQGGRFPKRPMARKRKFGADPSSPECLSRPQVERFHVAATRQLADARDDLGAMEEKLVAHHGVRREDVEHVALEPGRMRVGRSGVADQ